MRIRNILLLLLMISLQADCQEKWVNCIGNQISFPHRYIEPRNLEELSDILNQAIHNGQTLRTIGSGYSISEIGCTDGYLVNLKHLKNILSIDPKNYLVRVEAGITIQELNEQLAANNLALSNQAAITQITLGGALSTGVHGTGHTGSFVSFLREVELLTADGKLRKISQDSDSDAFSAASLSLGSLGVIYAVTLQCEPLFYLNASIDETNIEDILVNYKTLKQTNDFFQFFWNVDTGHVVVNRWNRCKQKTPSTYPCTESIACYKALPWYNIDPNDKDLFSEISIPIDSLPEVLKEIKQLVKKFHEVGAEIVDINVRFVDQDIHSLLSPSSEGPVATIAFCILEEDKYIDLYKAFEDILQAYKGRPHWGKINFLDHQKALGLYGINLQKFIKVKRRLDPQGVFSNTFTNRILGIKKKTARIGFKWGQTNQ